MIQPFAYARGTVPESQLSPIIYDGKRAGFSRPFCRLERKPPNNTAMALLPATVITPVSVIVPVTLEAIVWPTVLAFALSLSLPKESLPFTSSERIPVPIPVTVLIIVAIIPLRFGLRPAGDAGAGYESYS